ncbi:formate dehydrogenase accessory sulfurtransferase FdhD [Microbulbifer sp. SAOS-129_SWC]|uniref:formate dehydrogenase accessory sulfurtransferase FdhD n=1 Tax=Microbulbifer sp. SAOS-129_SWC TaxID=3145235 RepID=UPI003216BE32
MPELRCAPMTSPPHEERRDVGSGGDRRDAGSADHYHPLAEEAAVAISYNGLNHAVMMATPADLEDYAVGFSVCNGLAAAEKDILDIVIARHRDSATVDITVTQRAFQQLKYARRAQTGGSGCGLCGVAALEQALAQPVWDGEPAHAALPPAPHLHDLRRRFERAQQHLRRSGAMHAALYVDASGETRLCREDIGRHNALDKLIGACLRANIDLRSGFVAVTSRCGLELVQKAAGVRVGTLVSLSSPTDISVRWAREQRLNLIHQPAGDPARIYSPVVET